MPSAMPPITCGAAGAPTPSGCNRSGTAPAAGGGGAAAACAASADGGAQLPSAFTRSSGPTGPDGPSDTLALLGRAQSGLANTSIGFENKPPSFLLSRKFELPEQPATEMPAAQTSAICSGRRRKGNAVPPEEGLSVCPYDKFCVISKA